MAKRDGILNPALCHLLASVGHTDHFTICDAGYPVPEGQERIDLSLVRGQPTVLQVLTAVQAEFVIDRIVVAEEMAAASPEHLSALAALVGQTPIELVPHVAFKELSHLGRATVRTGDATPYANIIVVSG